MSSRVKGTDKKTGFDLLEHVTGGVHISSGPHDGRVVNRPLDYLSDADIVNYDSELDNDSELDDSPPPPTKRRRPNRTE